MTALAGKFGKSSYSGLKGSVDGMFGGLKIVSPMEAMKVIGKFGKGLASDALKMMPAAIKKSVQVFKRAAGMPFATRELEAEDKPTNKHAARAAPMAKPPRPGGMG